MNIIECDIIGLFVIEQTPMVDERGSFARTYCQDEFAAAGIDFNIVQTNVSRNAAALTLRGMHFQAAPKAEPKLVSCTSGMIFDVAVDLRPRSSSYCNWFGLELSAENHRALFIPAGFAHGFLTLMGNSEVTYLMGEFFAPELAHGVRWDDPAFSIDWPDKPEVISGKDAGYPDFEM